MTFGSREEMELYVIELYQQERFLFPLCSDIACILSPVAWFYEHNMGTIIHPVL
jgi:hypothetical protein